jgi:hypothetical protein
MGRRGGNNSYADSAYIGEGKRRAHLLISEVLSLIRRGSATDCLRRLGGFVSQSTDDRR